MRRQSFRPRPIDIYKKLPIVRSADDLTFEDESGIVQRVTKLDDVNGIIEANAKPRKKLNIPTPVVNTVQGYDKEHPQVFQPPVNYIRTKKKVTGEDEDLEYDLDYDDEIWLQSHPKYGDFGDPRYVLPSQKFEKMLDLLEKFNGRSFPPTLKMCEANNLFFEKLGLKRNALQRVGDEVYNYWIRKCAGLKKPLLRRWWPQTALNDTNPHHVFRPREKERYKLRKHRKNDMEAFRKLLMLRGDFERARELLELLKQREITKRISIDLFEELFEQARHEGFEGTGKRPLLEDMKLKLVIPKLVEDEKIIRRLKKKHKRSKKEGSDGGAAMQPSDLESRGLNGFETSSHLDRHSQVSSLGPGLSSGGKRLPPERTNLPTFMDIEASFWGIFECDEGFAGTFDSRLDRSPGCTCQPTHCRGRLGRCGRIMIDRSRISGHLHICQEEFAPPVQASCAGVSLAPTNPGAHESTASTGQATALTQAPSADLEESPGSVTNPARTAFSRASMQAQKLDEIYNLSDSEDELIEGNEEPIADKLALSSIAADPDVFVKYRLHL